MRVRAIDVDWDNLEVTVMPFASKSQKFFTPGLEYEVHAVSVYKKVVFVLVVDDIGTPIFAPSVLFEMVCSDTPTDWMCNLIGQHGVELVLGPDFVSKDLNAYNSIVDQEYEQIAKLWKRIDGN